VQPSLTSFPVPLIFSAVGLEEDALIEVVVDADGDTPDFESLGDAMNCFASVLSWGACPARGLGVTERPAVTLLPADVTGSQYRQSVRTRGLHHGAYRLLLTMLAQSHYDVIAMKRAQVRAAGIGDALSFDDILDAGFPAPPAALPFTLHIPTDLLGLEELVVRIRFATNDAARIFPDVRKRLNEWNNLVILGGYVETFEEAELQILPRETAERYADTIEHWIGAPSLNRAAVDGLLNVLCRIHGAVNPIVELEIE
jgi:hypothetical protein